VQIGKKIIEDVLLNGRLGMNIVTKHLKTNLGLFKPSLYNLRMSNHTTTKLVGLIRDMKMYAHGITNIVTFTILQNNVANSS
jgi:hypothetical protein